MTDFETMPIGTRAAVAEAAELFRHYETHHNREAAKMRSGPAGAGTNAETARREKAERNRAMAEKLEALL